MPRADLPLTVPLNEMAVAGSLFEIMPLIWDGAKGTRTPGLLHAMRIKSVDPRPAQSNGEPLTCNTALGQSGIAGGNLNTLAPNTGSRLPYHALLSPPPRGPRGPRSTELPGPKEQVDACGVVEPGGGQAGTPGASAAGRQGRTLAGTARTFVHVPHLCGRD
jgi:hypothetical protein